MAKRMNKLVWGFLDWVNNKDQFLVELDEKQNYHVNWGEVATIPEYTLGKLRCKLFNRHGFPFFGSCTYCKKELSPGDYIGWFEQYDPENNMAHNLLTNPLKMLPEILYLGAVAKIYKDHEDADALFKEAHK